MLYEKLETLCKEKGISIAKLERDCCIGNATVRRWDKAFPRIDTLKKVADYLGKPIEYFLE
ncbi:XRE family transcriptional regulator [bacterium 1xD8-48]|nr:XRE family transcriptional regulator [bacterium 1xD8-48]